MPRFPSTAALLCALTALAGPARAQETLPPGAPIADGVSIDLTEEGFTFLLGQVTGILPAEMVIGDIPSQELVDIFFCAQNFWLENLVIHTELNGLWADGTVNNLQIVASVNIQLNDAANPANMIFDGCLDYVCLLHTDPTDVEIRLPVRFALSADENGDPFVDVTIDGIQHDIEAAMQGAIHLTGCAIGEINEFLDQYLGFNAFDLVIGQLVGQIDAQIADQIAPLEAQIEDGLRALWLEDSIDVLDSSLHYDIHPTLIEHNDLGLRMVLGGEFDAEPADCIAAFDDAGSPFTDGALPAMSAQTPVSGVGYHAGILASDDLLNQALYAAWRGGVLCYAASDLGSLQLSTTYLGLLLGTESADRLTELLGEGESPIIIRTVPEHQPIAQLDGPHDIDILIEGLNIEFYVFMEGRFTRLASVAVDIGAGIDIFVDSTDALALDIDLDTSQLNPRVTYNEIAPDLNAAFETNFPGFLTTVIDSVAGSALEGMAFALPTFFGQGLIELIIELIGADPSLQDFLGAFAILGPSTGGVSSGGCGDGCADCSGGGCAGCEDLSSAEGCDLQQQIEEGGCSGESTGNPDDVGCQGCRILARQDDTGRWRVTLDRDGLHGHRRGLTRRVPLTAALLLLVPALVAQRRRRWGRERRS